MTTASVVGFQEILKTLLEISRRLLAIITCLMDQFQFQYTQYTGLVNKSHCRIRQSHAHFRQPLFSNTMASSGSLTASVGNITAISGKFTTSSGSLKASYANPEVGIDTCK
jgi:hypothetical protein